MEHAVHLGAGHFIKVVSPTSVQTLVKKNNAENEADDDAEVDFTVGDTIGKSLALVKQVSTS